MVINHPCLLIDACCLINLHASGRLSEIAEAVPAPVMVAQRVWEQEVSTLHKVESAAGTPAEQAIEEGIIKIAELESSEAETFVNYAAVLRGDGEAATCAIAFSRGWAVATDDRAAIRFVEREASRIQVVSTLELVEHWAKQTKKSPDSVRQVLIQIRDIGGYFPGIRHPMYAWWDGMIR